MSVALIILYTIPLLVPMILIYTAFYSLKLKRNFKPHYDKSFTPKVSIILPCKGAHSELKSNISSFFNLDYNNYEVIFVVEDENDTALPIIHEVLSKNDNGRVVIAGYATTCGQKNYNLVKAYETVQDSSVLIFADSDISLKPTWITSLVAPLKNEDTTAVTGFRWLYPLGVRLGELAHTMQNFILFTLFCTTSKKLNTGLWGGSMSIRVKDFEELNVKEYWLQTTVDDMSLSEILKREDKKTYFAFDSITPTSDTIKSFSDSIRWFKRQVLYLKAHQKPEWIASVVISSTYLWSFVLLIKGLIAFINGGNFFTSGGGIWILQILLVYVYTILFPVFGQKGRWKHFILASPISVATASWATLLTVFTNTIEWSGIKYTFRFKDGKVIKVER